MYGNWNFYRTNFNKWVTGLYCVNQLLTEDIALTTPGHVADGQR